MKFLKIPKQIFILTAILIVVSKLFLFLIYIFTSKNEPQSVSIFFSSLNMSDAEYYTSIFTHGYTTEVYILGRYFYNFNFFPSAPLSLKLFSYLLPNYNLSLDIYCYVLAFVLNAVISFFVAALSYYYIILTRQNESMAIASIILLIIGPFSFYFSEALSEPLFMLFLLLGLISLHKKQYIRCGIYGALLSLTRLTGVLFVLVILICIVQLYFKENNHKSIKGFIKYVITKPTLILGMCLVPLGLISFMIYLQVKFHDGLGFVHTQRYGFGLHYRSYFLVLFTAPTEQALVVIFSLVMCAYLIYKKRYYEAIIPIFSYLLMGYCTLLCIPRYFFGSVTVMYGFLEILYDIKCTYKTQKRLVISSISVACLIELILIYKLFSHDLTLVE